MAELNAALVGRIEALCADLMPGGRRCGSEWQDASTRNGGMGDSLSVRLRGPSAGVWAHFGGTGRGDLIDLIAYLRTGGDVGAAARWARDWLGLGGGAAGAGDRSAIAAQLDKAKAAAQARALAAEAESQQKARAARAMWLAAAPLATEDAAARYLAARGLGLDRLGRAPGALRCAAALVHGPSGQTWPAMVAAVVDGQGRHIATHRTFLDGRGGKAPLDTVKLTLGSPMGGHVPLWKGRHACTLRALPEGVRVWISEGIEDGLSVALLKPAERVISAVSLANLGRVELPETVREVVLIGQNDPETLPDGRPHPARLAFAAAVQQHAEAGRVVRRAVPPAGIKDFNDWLRQLQLGGEV